MDECATQCTDATTQVCTNTVGSFTCTCAAGYEQASAGAACTGDYSVTYKCYEIRIYNKRNTKL